MTLTQQDLSGIERIVDKKLNERLKFLPTKDEFFAAMDKVMGELETIRDELSLFAVRENSGIHRR